MYGETGPEKVQALMKWPKGAFPKFAIVGSVRFMGVPFSGKRSADYALTSHLRANEQVIKNFLTTMFVTLPSIRVEIDPESYQGDDKQGTMDVVLTFLGYSNSPFETVQAMFEVMAQNSLGQGVQVEWTAAHVYQLMHSLVTNK